MRRSEIARRRGTSLEAVKFHLANIGAKLGVGAGELRHWPGIPATSHAPARRPMNPMTRTPTALGPIGQVSLSIRDVARAKRFYGEILGLRHLFTFGDLVFFDAGNTRLYLHRRDEAEWQPGSILYFAVDDVHVAQEDLATHGVEFSGAPHRIHTHDDGSEEWMTFFADGEGNTLSLMGIRTGTATAVTG
jgi:predicted enzyme related to lactoylglutathione lyase